MTDIVDDVELLEPGKAIPAKRGYVGLARRKIRFPYVSSCLAAAAILTDGTIIGGHMGAEWSKGTGIDYEGNGKRVIDLMVANLENVGGKGKVAAVVTAGHGNWEHENHDVVREFWARFGAECALKVVCEAEVNVEVTRTEVVISQVAGKSSKTYKVPSGDWVFDTFR